MLTDACDFLQASSGVPAIVQLIDNSLVRHNTAPPPDQTWQQQQQDQQHSRELDLEHHRQVRRAKQGACRHVPWCPCLTYFLTPSPTANPAPDTLASSTLVLMPLFSRVLPARRPDQRCHNGARAGSHQLGSGYAKAGRAWWGFLV